MKINQNFLFIKKKNFNMKKINQNEKDFLFNFEKIKNLIFEFFNKIVNEKRNLIKE